MEKKYRIMFVCHGNICRSPMAELILRNMVEKEGRGSEFHIASSATSTEEIWGSRGNPIHSEARAELLAHGIPVSEHYATLLMRSDYDKYDFFIGMDSANIRNMHRIFCGDSEKKVSKLLDYTPRGGDVSDPWYSRRVDVAFRDIYEGCAAFLKALGEESKE